MDMAIRISTHGAALATDPSLVIAASAARQAATPTARLAARIDAGRAAATGDSARERGDGSFHAPASRRDAAIFVKPGLPLRFSVPSTGRR